MRGIIVTACCVICVAAGHVRAAMAQGMPPGLAGLQMVEPEPERAGDRALSCAQITREMGLIMEKRNARQATAAAKGKLCGSKQVLDRQAEAKKKLQEAQTPALVAAGLTPGPQSTAILSKVNADHMALEQQQQPERQQAQANMMSGAGDMMSVFNDPRLLRLSMLAQERQCAQGALPPPQTKPADACEGSGESLATSSIPRPPGKETSGSGDPFAQRGKSAPIVPAGSDPHAKPDPFARH